MARGLLAGLALALATAGLARADDFDARRPKDVAAVVTSNGASGDLKIAADGKPSLSAQAARIFFDVYFDDCDTGRALCDTVTFAGSWNTKKLDAAAINRWNRWTLFCPAYLDADGEPNMWYGLAVSAHTDRDDLAGDVERWMGCLQDFDDFIASPDDFMKRNGPTETPPAPAAAPAAPAGPAARHGA